MTPDAEVALAAVVAGSERVRAAFGQPIARFPKVGHDFATQADLDAEAAMLAAIATACPDDGRVAEESGTHVGLGTRRWLVDPLCGTLNFAAQTPLVAVNVALVDDASTLAAASADPFAEEVFWTGGDGGYLRSNGIDRPLGPTPASKLIDVNCDGPADRAWLGPQLLSDPAFRSQFSPRVLSTTLAVAWVAAGRRAGYVSDGRFLDNVHFAAGIAICRAAGCEVTDLRGEPLEAGRGLVVSAGADTHRQLLDIVAPHVAAVLGS